jgi:DNA-binding beta-propeller fold protein YncE
MKQRILAGLVLAGALVILVMPRLSPPLSGQASGPAPHIGEGGVPQFQLDTNWPKIPSKWKMGFGSAVVGDKQGHVWILSRPKTLAHPRTTAPDLTSTPAPPVMEFDQAGNFIQGWGGESGPGYQWPSNEHGLWIDSKGFVWIVGNADGKSNNPANLPNDNQVLKFTHDGKFVMAIGKSGQTGSNKTDVLKGTTSLYVDEKANEVYVSDGYGNARIIIFDANTGRMKRMWGAYGNKPLDPADRPQQSAPKANPWVTVSEVLQQFGSPIHDVKMSNDGLVYTADRGNKRVQVFTPEGKFIAEQFVGLDSNMPLQARGIAFSPDPEQRFLYTGGATVVYVLNRRTLEVLGSWTTGSPQGDTPGHLIGSDTSGNVYIVQAELTGANGKGGTGAFKWALKGYSPRVKCPPCEPTRPSLVASTR